MLQLTKLRARDIMQADVVRLDSSAPIREAIETLEDLEITGAPVVDSLDRLVGMLSTTDVSRIEHVRGSRIAPEPGDFARAEQDGEDGEDDGNEDVILDRENYSPTVLGKDTVADWMSPHVVAVDPDTTVREVCRKMLKEHVHRVIVAKQKRIEGIITTFDIVRRMAEDG